MSTRFTVTFVAKSGDGIRSLRLLLKRALRSYGLAAIDVREEPQPEGSRKKEDDRCGRICTTDQ